MVGLLVDNTLSDTEESNCRCYTSPGVGLNGLSENILHSSFSDVFQRGMSQIGPYKRSEIEPLNSVNVFRKKKRAM